MTERLDLRPITWADADRLAVFHADARVMNLLQHGVLTRAQSDALVATYEAEWPALGFGNWTATERATGQLVGLGGLRVHTGDYGVAIRLAFAPEAQGKGVGRKLVKAVADTFKERGITSMLLWVLTDNAPSRAFYESLGGQPIEEKQFELGGATLTEVGYGWPDTSVL